MIYRLISLVLIFGFSTMAQQSVPYAGPCNKPRKNCAPPKNGVLEWIIGEVKDSPNRCWWTCDSTLSATLPEKIEAANSCYEFTNSILINEGWGTIANVNKSANLVSRSVRMYRETKLPLITAQSFRTSSKQTKLLGRKIVTTVTENKNLPEGEKTKWVLKIQDDRDESHTDKPKGSYQRTYVFRTHGDTCELESVTTLFNSDKDSINSNELVTSESCRDASAHRSTSMLQLCAETSKYFPAIAVDKDVVEKPITPAHQ